MSDEPRIPADRWPARRPPVDFADRVMAQLDRDDAVRRARRFTFAAAAAVVLIAGGTGAFLSRDRGVPDGDFTATERTEVDVAPGVRAVVEREGHIRWTKAGVTQATGDVFYRADPGRKLRVATPRGEIASQGTCSRVVVDAKPEAPAVVLVSVAQGDVSFGGVALTAGRYARADVAGLKTDRDDHDGTIALALARPRVGRLVPTEAPSEPPLAPAPVASIAAPAVRSTQRPTPRASGSAAPPPPPSASATSKPPIVPACVCSPLHAICDCQP